mmetsp:Transcript_29469/g.43518  ORF Transcript_29469/g.43518 Transcript_29469/m.43518 type:complete len:85 (-) Transcript_29469:743-997(-)
MEIEETIRKKISQLDAEHVNLTIEEGCEGGAKVHLVVVSEQFKGVSLLKRHKMINSILSDELADNTIHALTIKAWTPAQHQSKK